MRQKHVVHYKSGDNLKKKKNHLKMLICITRAIIEQFKTNKVVIKLPGTGCIVYFAPRQ